MLFERCVDGCAFLCDMGIHTHFRTRVHLRTLGIYIGGVVFFGCVLSGHVLLV